MSLKNFFFLLLLILAPVFIQSSALNVSNIRGIKPDLVLIVACYIGLQYEESTATSLGFVLGLLQDIFSANMLGLNALTKTLSAYLCSKATKRFNVRNVIVQVLIILSLSLLEGLIFFYVLQVFNLRQDFQGTLQNPVLPQTIYNAILTPFLFQLINLLHQRWNRQDD